MFAKKLLAIGALSMGTMGLPCSAADYSFTGTFQGDADRQFFAFLVDAISDVTIRSYSYGGGTMSDGTVVDPGGFDPHLSLFHIDGALIDQFDDSPAVEADPATGERYDFNEVLRDLAPGGYVIALTQYDNSPVGDLGAGFSQNDPFFTATSLSSCSVGQFCDFDGNSRTNAWALDILGVAFAEIAPVPLPAGLPLLFGGLAGLGVALRKREAAASIA